MNRWSSTRLIGAPRTSGAGAMAIAVLLSARRSGGGCGGSRRRCRGRGAGTHRDGGLADRGHDVVVARAAADIPLDRVPDLVVARIRVVGEEVRGHHDHPRRAEAALEPVLLPERVLERVQRAVAGLHSLDRRDVRAIRLDREHRAAFHGLAIDGDGARAALARVAPDVGPGELQVLAEELDEHASWLDIPL